MSHHKPYFNADFNSASLGAEEWARLYTELSCLLDYGYVSLLAEAHVSYLEIAVDCTGIAWKGLLPFDSQLRNSLWYPNFSDPAPCAHRSLRRSGPPLP